MRRMTEAVSTHAPLRQRGEPDDRGDHRVERAMFQPTPRFVSEANVTVVAGDRVDRQVSTHAPLRQRGERSAAMASRIVLTRFNPRPASSARRTVPDRAIRVKVARFNPRPASSARRTIRRRHAVGMIEFQPTPRFVSEANGLGGLTERAERVSTHAPLRQRGERRPQPTAHPPPFQPTPRFVSEANRPPRTARRAWNRFNPRPASSARRTCRSSSELLGFMGFNPRPASSARRTIV